MGVLFSVGEAGGTVIEVLFEHLRDAIGQGTDAVGAEAERTSAADAG